MIFLVTEWKTGPTLRGNPSIYSDDLLDFPEKKLMALTN
jgi:hypothetical protein